MSEQGTAYIFSAVCAALEKKQHPLPELKQGEVLVSIEMTTICTSDLLTLSGKRQEPAPLVLGHEIVGRITALPDQSVKDMQGTVLRLGDRISWSVFSAPADNSWAQQGMRQKSPQVVKYGHRRLSGQHYFSGGFATHCHLLADTCLMKVSEDIPLASICPVNCSLATVIGGVRLAGSLQQKRVLITGGGMLGIYACAVARQRGASQVVVVEPLAERIKTCLRFGADDALSPEDFSAGRDEEFDVTLDTSGNLLAMQAGLKALATGGIAIWLGAVYPQSPLGVDTETVVRKLLTIRGLHNYNETDFRQAIQFMEENHACYPFTSLVEKVFSLEDVEEAINFAKQHKPYRVGLQPRPV